MYSPSGSSPHTRGARPGRHRQAQARRIIPAYAGSTARTTRVSTPGPDHPRIRGEHLHWSPERCRQCGSSPHTRGALPAPLVGRDGVSDHPRIRGEHDIITATGCRPWGSSPHTRGARRRRRRHHGTQGIIPAYAGSTASTTRASTPVPDHPRIRGEHRLLEHGEIQGAGSSPHTRGARILLTLDPLAQRIIPAYAGSTANPWIVHAERRDHPRIRGEHALPPLRPASARGSSPHTRGAPAGRSCAWEPTGIIPAYAGSTGCSLAAGSAAWDHPRIRGEH